MDIVLNNDEIDVINIILIHSKMNNWCNILPDNRFYDLEKHKCVTTKSAIHDIYQGMTEQDFNCLTNEQKFILINIASKLL